MESVDSKHKSAARYLSFPDGGHNGYILKHIFRHTVIDQETRESRGQNVYVPHDYTSLTFKTAVNIWMMHRGYGSILRKH